MGFHRKASGISKTDKIIFDTVNQLIPDDVKSLSIVHTEEITPASESNVLRHSYGETPYHFIITTEDFDWNIGVNYAIINITYDVIGNDNFINYKKSNQHYIGGLAAINISSTGIGDPSSSYKFAIGHTYKLYVFA